MTNLTLHCPDCNHHLTDNKHGHQICRRCKKVWYLKDIKPVAFKLLYDYFQDEFIKAIKLYNKEPNKEYALMKILINFGKHHKEIKGFINEYKRRIEVEKLFIKK